jgi:spore protease
MGESIDLSQYSVRTDLAIEAREMVLTQQKGSVGQEKDLSQIEGVIIKEKDVDDIKISLVEVTEKGAQQLGKKAGRYLTVEVQGIRQQNTEVQQKVEEIFAREFSHFLEGTGIKKTDSCLVVGLGNWNVTPDALGPMVCENLLVTRHLFQLQLLLPASFLSESSYLGV